VVLPGYLILFAPTRFRISASVLFQKIAFDFRYS